MRSTVLLKQMMHTSPRTAAAGQHQEPTAQHLNSPTMAATATAAAVAATAAVTSTSPLSPDGENCPLLLRTWNANSPPVAPAVVVEATSETSNGSGGPAARVLGVGDEFASRYSYPVATFVLDLVRTSITVGHELPLSVRSEPSVSIASAAVSASTFHNRPPFESTSVSANAQLTGLGDDDDDDAEFILVDGDLIAVPPPPPNAEEQQALEENLRDVEAARRSCQGNRLRRGVRKFNKLFKRSRRRMYQEQDQQQQQQYVSPHTLSDRPYTNNTGTTPAGFTGNSNAAPTTQSALLPAVTGVSPVTIPHGAEPTETDTTGDGDSSSSPSRNRKNKRRNQPRQRRSWRRTDSNEITDTHNDAAPSSATAAAATTVATHPATTAAAASTGAAPRLAAAAAASFQAVSRPLGRRNGRSRTPPRGAPGGKGGREPSPPRGGRQHRQQQSLLNPEHPHTAGVPARTPLTPNASAGLMCDHSHGTDRTQSVTASFVGTADQLLEAGVLPADMAAEAYVEFEDAAYFKKLDDDMALRSLVPRDADLKVDKADAPDVESMLRRAMLETEDSDTSGSSFLSDAFYGQKRDSSAGASVPLSFASGTDRHVYNDTLKVVLVGCPLEKTWLARALRGSNKKKMTPTKSKRTTLAVDVHTWTPSTPTAGSPSNTSGGNDDSTVVKFSIWDTQGAAHTLDGSPNFGCHPATQSLFFSSQSLYVLVWDLAGNKPKTFYKSATGARAGEDCDDDEEEEEDEDYSDEFVREENNRQADRLLQADIQSRVLSWVDCIVRSGPKSAILPLAIIPQGMCESEVQRRCSMMLAQLQSHIGRQFLSGNPMTVPKLLAGADNILCVNYTEGSGIEQLRDTIVDIATDSSRSVFQHVGTPVPEGTALVLDVIRRLKQDHKLIIIDYLMGEVGATLTVNQVMNALHFLSSTGEILYFGTDDDEVLSRFIILSRKWLVSAISCILRNDLKRELDETRRFMNMQCLYSDDRFIVNEMTVVLAGSTTSSCPLLSDRDAMMLWQSMSFMREAADRYSQLSDSTTTTPTMFYFLERLLVHSGILVPLGSSQSSLDRSEVFFVPSLLPQVDPRDIWTYRSSESWMTTLCHSWLFRDGAPSHVMEDITVGVLRDLYEFSRSFQGTLEPRPLLRTKTVPIGQSTLHEFYEEHRDQAIGRVRIHQIMCWESSMLVKVGTVFADQETNELRESFVEILITVVGRSYTQCVASDAMRGHMHRVIVSGKGQVGHHGQKIWKGGYKVILDSVRATLESYANVDSQVVCPECLAQSHPNSASTWSWDSVQAATQSGSAVVRCMRGHRVDSNLICGTCTVALKAPPTETAPSVRNAKPVKDMLPSVVLIGLWDPRQKQIRSVGSGFVVDRKLGLVITAGHVLFNMEVGRNFGAKYFGLKDARVVIGVIPEDGDGHNAVFRYFADIVADDINSVDACVLRIRGRMEKDIDDEGPGCDNQDEKPLLAADLQNEQLRSLKLTSRFQLEEEIRILGFNQGGEGVFELGKHVNRTADFAKGYICKLFKAPSLSDDSSSHSSESSSHCTFSPREEIVVIVPTISGHSGGACVNDEGKVVGILSRADPVDRQRCYLVPATELKILVNKARQQFLRPAPIMNIPTI